MNAEDIVAPVRSASDRLRRVREHAAAATLAIYDEVLETGQASLLGKLSGMRMSAEEIRQDAVRLVETMLGAKEQILEAVGNEDVRAVANTLQVPDVQNSPEIDGFIETVGRLKRAMVEGRGALTDDLRALIAGRKEELSAALAKPFLNEDQMAEIQDMAADEEVRPFVALTALVLTRTMDIQTEHMIDHTPKTEPALADQGPVFRLEESPLLEYVRSESEFFRDMAEMMSESPAGMSM